MSELRQDVTTNDWVIIARERARRPDDFRVQESHVSSPSFSSDCPFCPGNESRTPEATALYGDEQMWRLRVVPNKFGALSPDGSTIREEKKFFRKAHGYGRHEVIIETPVHNEFIPFMSHMQVQEILRVYRDRYLALRNDMRIKQVVIFKNHGAGAGTSLEHPHSQVVASPIVPPMIRRRYEIATQYFDNTGRCLYCDLRIREIEKGERIIKNSDQFVALHPFASHFPFETWILPKSHKSSFGSISEEEIDDLAGVLKEILLKLHRGLGNPDYNLIVHTSPVDDENKSYYLWHIQIVPRLIEMAGFELGSGIHINVALPEETAASMRDLVL
jgi:UDPglucose--hexose-1-phosphate uridylyltransferase